MTNTTETRPWQTFDVVKGMLANMKTDKITANVPKLHGTLFKIAEVDRFHQFFEEYVFEQRSSFPFSRDFQTDLLNLEQAGHLATSNPDFVVYELRPKLRNTFQKYGQPLFTDQDIATIREMAQQFEAEVTSPAVA